MLIGCVRHQYWLTSHIQIDMEGRNVAASQQCSVSVTPAQDYRVSPVPQGDY